MSAMADKIKGKAMQVEGKLTGDKVRHGQGTAKKAKGEAESMVGRAARKVKRVARSAKRKVQRATSKMKSKRTAASR
jgi:uncharacterized protein YjbJ (UPF0337 family)